MMRNSQHLVRGGGFSLTESLVIIAITVFALLALVHLMLSFNSVFGYQRVFMETAGSAGSALTHIEAAVLPANRILASYTFSGTLHTSATTTLVLEVPSIDETGAIIPGAKDYFAFYRSGTTLYRRIHAGAGSARLSGEKVLSSVLSSITFTYNNAHIPSATSVSVDIRTSGSFKTQTAHSHLILPLYLRNATST